MAKQKEAKTNENKKAERGTSQAAMTKTNFLNLVAELGSNPIDLEIDGQVIQGSFVADNIFDKMRSFAATLSTVGQSPEAKLLTVTASLNAIYDQEDFLINGKIPNMEKYGEDLTKLLKDEAKLKAQIAKDSPEKFFESEPNPEQSAD